MTRRGWPTVKWGGKASNRWCQKDKITQYLSFSFFLQLCLCHYQWTFVNSMMFISATRRSNLGWKKKPAGYFPLDWIWGSSHKQSFSCWQLFFLRTGGDWEWWLGVSILEKKGKPRGPRRCRPLRLLNGWKNAGRNNQANYLWASRI